jgi:hypothetical protein
MPASDAYKKASPRRKQRIAEEVAPLVVQGLTTRQIGKRLGLSAGMAHKDVALVRDMWQESFNASRDEWAPRILATYEWLMTECAAAWQDSKAGRVTRITNPDGTEMVRQEPPDPRWLSGMLAVAKEASTFLGLRQGVDSVSRVEVPEATRAALAPMSADAYMAMLATGGGGLAGLTQVPPVQQQEHTVNAVDVHVVERG